jgi:SAM-dependent methyltransferase
VGRDVYELPPRPLPPEEAGVTRRSLLRLGPTRQARRDIDYVVITERVRSAWESHTPDSLLRALEPAAEAIVRLAGVGPGARVADVGAGDGNVAVLCAARGAEVTACDLAPGIVERGRARCGRDIQWTVADAQSLPFAGGSFDAVLSAFGTALAPRWDQAARELCRVVRPGGLVIVTGWVPRGLPGGLFEIAQDLDPLPEAVPTPAEWGRQEVVRARLEPLLEGLELRTRSVRLRFRDEDDAFAALCVWTALEPEQLAALRPQFDRLLASCNNSVVGVEIDARYLIALGRRPPSGDRA